MFEYKVNTDGIICFATEYGVRKLFKYLSEESLVGSNIDNIMSLSVDQGEWSLDEAREGLGGDMTIIVSRDDETLLAVKGRRNSESWLESLYENGGFIIV